MKKRRVEQPAASEEAAVHLASPSAGPQEDEDSDTTARNDAHRRLVASRLGEQPRYGALEAALTDLASIARDCDALGVEFAMFAALDELMAGMDHD